jgi:uncharacterized protein (DUF2384 family)
MTDGAGTASPRAHWKRRPKTPALPRDQAVRQGEITRLAFLVLGRERAIAFLNSDHPTLGGRPLDLATGSDAGRDSVETELGRAVYSDSAAPRQLR